ncbi:hypothetical protein AGLY_017892 [Aphis glycines]|uniref:Uncharacterized protein n=1 Tax=Aphis glycines TaxID=307491 RepID=A0A6G0SUC9_APHGL|nr:hypothetical protein AGLY_017892 [Aphis glycines]
MTLEKQTELQYLDQSVIGDVSYRIQLVLYAKNESEQKQSISLYHLPITFMSVNIDRFQQSITSTKQTKLYINDEKTFNNLIILWSLIIFKNYKNQILYKGGLSGGGSSGGGGAGGVAGAAGVTGVRGNAGVTGVGGNGRNIACKLARVGTIIFDALVTHSIAITLSHIGTICLAIFFSVVLLVSVLFGTRVTLNRDVVGKDTTRSTVIIVANRIKVVEIHHYCENEHRDDCLRQDKHIVFRIVSSSVQYCGTIFTASKSTAYSAVDQSCGMSLEVVFVIYFIAAEYCVYQCKVHLTILIEIFNPIRRRNRPTHLRFILIIQIRTLVIGETICVRVFACKFARVGIIFDALVTQSVAITLSHIGTHYNAITFSVVLLVSVLFGTQVTLSRDVVGFEHTCSNVNIEANRIKVVEIQHYCENEHRDEHIVFRIVSSSVQYFSTIFTASKSTAYSAVDQSYGKSLEVVFVIYFIAAGYYVYQCKVYNGRYYYNYYCLYARIWLTN